MPSHVPNITKRHPGAEIPNQTKHFLIFKVLIYIAHHREAKTAPTTKIRYMFIKAINANGTTDSFVL